MNFREAGISVKNGKAYNSFYSCPQCGNKLDVMIPPGGKIVEAAPTLNKPSSPNWDEIAVGKCASTYIEAWITKHGIITNVDDEVIQEAFDLARKVVYWNK